MYKITLLISFIFLSDFAYSGNVIPSGPGAFNPPTTQPSWPNIPDDVQYPGGYSTQGGSWSQGRSTSSQSGYTTGQSNYTINERLVINALNARIKQLEEIIEDQNKLIKYYKNQLNQ